MGLFHIENAYENIVAASEEKLSELFPAGIPEDVLNRYHKELNLLRNSESLIDFEIHRCISAEVRKNSAVMYTGGYVTGSILYYLLSTTGYNPLPTYYYCSQCGYYEAVETRLFGVDLPVINCPICGREISADGFRMLLESVQSDFMNGKVTFEYHVSSAFQISARSILEQLFPDNEIVPLGMQAILTDELHNPVLPIQVVGVDCVGYAIIKKGHTINDFSDISGDLDSGERCLVGGGSDLEKRQIKPVYLFHAEELDNLEALEKIKGCSIVDDLDNYLKEITWNNLCDGGGLASEECKLFSLREPETFTEMVSTYADAHNTYAWQKLVWQSDQPEPFDYNEYSRLIHSELFQKYPCSCREDFFDFLCDAGMPTEKAFEVAESIAKGKMEILDMLQVPDELGTVAKNYRYLFPRAHCVEMLRVKAYIAYFSRLCKEKRK